MTWFEIIALVCLVVIAISLAKIADALVTLNNNYNAVERNKASRRG